MNWRAGTPCAEQGPVDEIWFPADSADAQKYALKAAKTICGGCLSRDACLEYALSLPDNESHGIYAATTREQRRRLRRNGGRESRGKFGPRPLDACLRGHDTSGPDSRDAGNRCRECRREDRRKDVA